jgi:hypothetical protein
LSRIELLILPERSEGGTIQFTGPATAERSAAVGGSGATDG